MSGVREAAGEAGVSGIADVDHVEAAPARLAAAAAADGVRETGFLVDHDVVRTEHAIVTGRLLEHHRGIADLPQLGEVEDLDAVRAGVVRHDEGVVGVGLDVAPQVLHAPFG